MELHFVEQQKMGFLYKDSTLLVSPFSSHLTHLLRLFSFASQGQSQPVQVLCCTIHRIAKRIIVQPVLWLQYKDLDRSLLFTSVTMLQALPRENVPRPLHNVITKLHQPARTGLSISLGELHCAAAPVYSSPVLLPKEDLPSSQSHAFPKNLEFPDTLWSCCNLFLQDEHTNSNLRQIKESSNTDASCQIPSAIVQVF